MSHLEIFKNIEEGDTVYLEYYLQTALFEGEKTVGFIEYEGSTETWENKRVSFEKLNSELPTLVVKNNTVYVEVDSIDSPRGWTEIRELYDLEIV